MPRRAHHLAEHCLKVPGDASRTAENGSRLGSRSGAWPPCSGKVDAQIPPHHPGLPAHPRAPLATWAARYDSLRQVTTEDLVAELDTLSGATRLLALSAMRSLFGTL
jgi:hypothetical protein